MNSFPGNLSNRLACRELDGSLRQLRLSSEMIDLYSNDYLGLANSPEIYQQADSWLAARKFQRSGSTGSRLLSGNSAIHLELESILQQFYKAERAVLFNSGYDANLGLLGSIIRRGDLVLMDELVHASIREGVRSSLGRALKFRHNDLNQLQELYDRNKPEDGNCYVVTESVFSMDGDSPNLGELANWCVNSGVRLIVDEAHAVGLFGPNGSGRVVDAGLEEMVFARVVTFGKAVGCHGAAVLGSTQLIEFLVNFAKPLIYSTSLPPHSLACIAVAHEAVTNDELRKKLWKLIDGFEAELNSLSISDYFVPSDSAIRCAVIRGNDQVKKASAQLAKHGFDVRPIISPTVPLGTERLRFCLHAYNTAGEIEKALSLVAQFYKGE
ncbi:aminotransferase class I/II-fold pyridoxal phosphate-dependent enzyme [Aureitalea marina]|uniref:Aminotransferase class I/classII large domain-containing protein n=1 Tax=Aureitalea marina TaxID=930804 RepID=A0A2S7KSS3_9FLAO|nr:8-amino-7-oxononanoate synthase [Aureitalea marina]PQB05666.1 hypothetical protein BST85_12735 [Aureitalea marina]